MFFLLPKMSSLKRNLAFLTISKNAKLLLWEDNPGNNKPANCLRDIKICESKITSRMF